MVYTGYKLDKDKIVIKESTSRELLESEGFEYIASTNRDKEYLESLLKHSIGEKQ